MTNPFRFSPGIYDMTCGRLPNYFNLQANMYMADVMARANLYNVPTLDFGTFMPYGGFSIPGNLIFQSVLGQAHYQSLQNGGAGIFNSDGTLNLTGNIFGGYGFGSQLGANYSPFGGIGITPWQTPGVDNGNGNGGGKTDDEREAEDILKNKNTSLVAILNKYKELKGKDIDTIVESKITTALGKPDSKPQDKYEALEKALKAIGKDELRKVIPNLGEYRSELVKAGYDYENSNCFEESEGDPTDLIRNAKINYTTIKEKADKGQSIALEDLSGLSALATDLSLDANDSIIKPKDLVLNYISLWNENEPGATIIEAMQTFITKIENTGSEGSEERRTQTTKLVKPFVDALSAKARECAKASEEKDEIITKANNLDNLYAILEADYNNTTNWTNLINEFNELYTELRAIEAQRINKDIQKKYGFINDIVDGVITGDLIIQDTIDDLNSEGIEKLIDYNNSDNNNNIQANVNKLVSDGVVKQNDIDNVTYYQETTKTGGRDYLRVFVINDNKLQEIKGARIKDGAVVDENGKPINEPEYTETTTSSVTNDYNNAKRVEERKQEVDTAQTNMKSNGRRVWEKLSEVKSKNRYSNTIKTELGKVTESNVLAFLDGVYEAKDERIKGNSYEGFIEKLEDDTNIDITTIKGVIDDLINYAKKNGFEGLTELGDLEAVLNDFNDRYPEAKTFNKLHSGWGWHCFLVTMPFAPHTNYSEKLDECVEALYEKIKEIQAK